MKSTLNAHLSTKCNMQPGGKGEFALESEDPHFKTRPLVEFAPGCFWFHFWAALVNSQLVNASGQLGFLTVVVLLSCFTGPEKLLDVVFV